MQAYAASNYELLVPAGTAEDKNDRATREKILAQCLRNLRFVTRTPRPPNAEERDGSRAKRKRLTHLF